MRAKLRLRWGSRANNGSGWSLVALTVFKTVRDLTSSGWVGSIPMHSRHGATRGTEGLCRGRDAMQWFRHSLLISALMVSPLIAQRPDSLRASALPTVSPSTDSLRPPISPRRALLYGFLAPGYAQSVLGRHKAASGFLLVEAISLAMIRESAADLHEARRFENDSLVVSYAVNGQP